MKKIFFSIALISAAVLSSYAATNTSANTDSNTRTECPKDGCECKKGRAGHDGKHDRGMRAFEGITLTDAQKTQIDALRAEAKAKKEAAKKDKAERKENKEKLTAEQKQQMKAEKQAKRQQEWQEFSDKVKAVLTPEQYAKFLDNTKQMAERKDKGMKKGGKDSKDRKGHHTNKGGKGKNASGKSQRGNSQQG